MIFIIFRFVFQVFVSEGTVFLFTFNLIRSVAGRNVIKPSPVGVNLVRKPAGKATQTLNEVLFKTGVLIVVWIWVALPGNQRFMGFLKDKKVTQEKVSSPQLTIG